VHGVFPALADFCLKYSSNNKARKCYRPAIFEVICIAVSQCCLVWAVALTTTIFVNPNEIREISKYRAVQSQSQLSQIGFTFNFLKWGKEFSFAEFRLKFRPNQLFLFQCVECAFSTRIL
jgi:hypothetical protein